MAKAKSPKKKSFAQAVAEGEEMESEAGTKDQAAGKGKTPAGTGSQKNPKKTSKAKKPQRRRCHAKSKSTGEQCKLAPLKGQKVCKYHGGNTKAAKRKGKREEAKAKALETAGRMMERAGVKMDPIDHLLDSLHMAAQLVNVFGLMVSEIDDAAEMENTSDAHHRGEMGYEIVESEQQGRTTTRFVVTSRDQLMTLDKHSVANLHPYVVAFINALKDRAKIAKMCVDAGIAEMQMELAEQQAEMMRTVLEETLDEMKLGKEKRKEFMRTHARRLRTAACTGSSITPDTLRR